jgi:hypothetical protein
MIVEDIRDGGVHIYDMCLEFASMEVVNKGIAKFAENLAIFMQANTRVFSWNGWSSWMA